MLITRMSVPKRNKPSPTRAENPRREEEGRMLLNMCTAGSPAFSIKATMSKVVSILIRSVGTNFCCGLKRRARRTAANIARVR